MSLSLSAASDLMAVLWLTVEVGYKRVYRTNSSPKMIACCMAFKIAVSCKSAGAEELQHPCRLSREMSVDSWMRGRAKAKSRSCSRQVRLLTSDDLISTRAGLKALSKKLTCGDQSHTKRFPFSIPKNQSSPTNGERAEAPSPIVMRLR